MNQIMTLKEVAELLRLHPGTLYKLLRGGATIPYFKVGADYRFSREAIDQWRMKQ